MMQDILAGGLTALQSLDEINRWDNRPFCGVWPESRREKPTDIKRTIKKKPKRIRTAYTTDQLKALEIIYNQNKYVTSERRREISKTLNVGDKSVKIWFQNRRMKEKRESSESSSDSSNEASVCEMSPPTILTTEMQNFEPVTDKVNQFSVHSCTPEVYQYQIPNFNMNNEQTPGSHAPDNVLTNSMQFYYDNNIYPTHYYPPNDNSHCNDYIYYQYQQQEVMYSNYWNSNNAESCYFYN